VDRGSRVGEQEHLVNDAGFLAIWSDVRIEQETDYLHWLTREHTSERLGVEGFLRVRVYRSLEVGIRRYFIHYELRSPDVVGSAAYLARLNTPTPWSQRIMPILGNFIRGGGRVLARAGIGEGAFLAALRLDDIAPIAGPALVANIVKEDRIAAAELLETDAKQSSIPTREKSLREHDRSYAGLLLIEGLDEASVAASVSRLGFSAPDNVYVQVFQLFPQGGKG
jgi:hypothetical protein